MTLDGRELRAVGSAGQQRTAAVALRLLEAETYQRRSGSAPVFLMDDPFAELDAKRGAAIVSVLQRLGDRPDLSRGAEGERHSIRLQPAPRDCRGASIDLD